MIACLFAFLDKNERNQLMCSFHFFFVLSRLGAVMCMGVTAGAYILTLFAVCFIPFHDLHGLISIASKFVFNPWDLLVFFFNALQQMKYRQRVLGLILISPLCQAPSWTEWLCNKVLTCNFCGILRVK